MFYKMFPKKYLWFLYIRDFNDIFKSMNFECILNKSVSICIFSNFIKI